MSSEEPEFDLRVTPDGLRLLLSCGAPEPATLTSLVERIEKQIATMRLAQPPSQQDLLVRLKAAAKAKAPILDAVIAVGQPPTPPKHGEIQWQGDFFATGYAVDEKTGAMDYWSHAEKLQVQNGQLLAIVVLPQKGAPGKNLYGRPVPPERPRPARIRVGARVRKEEKEGAFYLYADSPGRLRWANDIVAVDDVYEIRDDVGIKTGHIKHPGAVVIQGDVLKGAIVQADGDVQVGGIIEEANVYAGGNLTVRGGITGAEGCKTRVGGKLEAKFVVDADVEVRGDVEVAKEIVQSKVKTRGSLMVPHGRIVGGEITALGDITVGQAGSVSGLRTILISGRDYVLGQRLAGREAEALKLVAKLDKIEQAIAPFEGMEDRLTSEQRSAVRKLRAQADQIRQGFEKASVDIDDVRDVTIAKSRPSIKILRKAFNDVVVCLKYDQFHVQDTLDGPLETARVKGKVMLTRSSSH